jgi:hypothetical protein
MGILVSVMVGDTLLSHLVSLSKSKRAYFLREEKSVPRI